MLVSYSPTDSKTHQALRFTNQAAEAASCLSGSIAYTEIYGASACVWLIPGREESYLLRN